MGGKRVRPVISLAVGEALGRRAGHGDARGAGARAGPQLLARPRRPARRSTTTTSGAGKPSVWAAYGEGKAVLAGDALLAEAFRLACSYPTPHVARELAQATLGMIGGQYLDTMEPGTDLEARPPAEDGLPVRRVRRDAALGGGSRRVRSRARGGRSATSSGCSSRSSTTSSTVTATSSPTASTGPATLANRAGERAHALARGGRRRHGRCSPRSSTGSTVRTA